MTGITPLPLFMLRRQVDQCSSLAQRKGAPPVQHWFWVYRLRVISTSWAFKKKIIKKNPIHNIHAVSFVCHIYVSVPCTTHVLMHNSSSSPLFVKNSLHIYSPRGSGKNKVLACLAALIEFEETLFYTMEIGLAFDAKWVLGRKRSCFF